MRSAGLFFSFGRGITIGAYLGGGWGGWGGWGWQPEWGNRTVIVNNNFVHRYNFNSARVTNFTGTTTWSHDAVHRQGVPYPAPALTDRYRAGVRQNLGRGTVPTQAPPQARSNLNPVNPVTPGRQTAAPTPFERNAPAPAAPAARPVPARPAPAPAAPAVQAPQNQPGDRIGNRQIAPNAPNRNRSAFGGIENGGAAQAHTDHGYSSLGAARAAPAPAPRPQAPAQSQGSRGRPQDNKHR